MAARALARFTVQHGRLRVQVRLLPTVADVDAEFRAGKRRRNGLVTFAYFAAGDAGPHRVGTIVLPANANLMELIPHEVTHAVMAHLVGVHSGDDESLATSVGKLTTRIVNALHQRGWEV